MNESSKWLVVANIGKVAISIITSTWIATDLDIQILTILLSANTAMSLFASKLSFWLALRTFGVTMLFVLPIHWIFGMATGAGLNLGIVNPPTILTSFFVLNTLIKFTLNTANWITIPPRFIEALQRADGLIGPDAQKLAELKRKQEGALSVIKETQSMAGSLNRDAQKATKEFVKTTSDIEKEISK